jgi:hypothetical protein
MSEFVGKGMVHETPAVKAPDRDGSGPEQRAQS